MFQKMDEKLPEGFLSSNSMPNSQSIPSPILPISGEDYQSYVAFLSQSCQQMTSDDHVIFLVKTAFDCCLEKLGEELFTLTENEDMFLHYVMYSTFKNCHLCSEEEFEQHRKEILGYYQATDDEVLFIEKIEMIITASLIHHVSPFSYLKAHENIFSVKVQAKLTDMLKFIIGHSMAFLLPPNQIFGLCLKWTLDQYHINNQLMNQLVQSFLDINTVETAQKLSQISQIMDEIFNMNSQ